MVPNIPVHSSATRAGATFWATLMVCVNTEIRVITLAPPLFGRPSGQFQRQRSAGMGFGYQGDVVCKRRPSPMQVKFD